MTDLLDLQIKIKHHPFGNIRVKEFEDGSATNASRFSKTVRFNPGGSPVYVTSLGNGNVMSIRCSPLKTLQGHNVFGSNDVIAIASEIICATLNQLGVSYSKDQAESWASGDFEIKAIDLTHRFCLPDGLTSFDVCQHLLRTSPVKLLKPQWLDQGTGIRLSTENSGSTWLLYDKEQELRDKRKNAFSNLKAVVGSDAKVVWRELQKIAGSTVRAELKLKRDYLNRHGLSKGRVWTAKSARSLYFSELGGLPSDVPISLERAFELLKSRSLKFTLLLWSTGSDLRKEFPSSTLRHHRQEIMRQTGIDIGADIPTPSTVKLSQIFCRDNVHRLPTVRAFGAAAFLPKG